VASRAAHNVEASSAAGSGGQLCIEAGIGCPSLVWRATEKVVATGASAPAPLHGSFFRHPVHDSEHQAVN
jgi:hypothetical protein